MGSPTVTVVIPTYNRANLVLRAIRSVQAQTYKNLIIAVYDNASADETQPAIEELARTDLRIRYHRHPHNVGVEANFHAGLKGVETPLFCFLSDDDLIFPHFVREAVSWLNRFPDARFAGGGTLEMTDAGDLLFSPQSYWPRDGCFVPPEGLDLMLSGFHPAWTTTIFRRRVLEEVGGLSSGLVNVGDCEFTFRIACRYPFVVFRRPCGIFVRHGNSGTESADLSIIDQYEAILKGLLSATDVGAHTKAVVSRTIPEALRRRVLQIAVKQLLRLEPAQARTTLSAYHKRYPKQPSSMFVDGVARVGVMFPSCLKLLGPLDAMRRRARRALSTWAAKANGVESPDRGTCAAYLRSVPAFTDRRDQCI